MDRCLLPTGIQSFRKLREGNCYYVDKTGYLLRLVSEGAYFLLSRPRRFGKSLFLDTLKELFEGSRELFKGLRIYERWDWSVRHPVVRLDFSDGDFTQPGGLQASLSEQLGAIERSTATERFSETAPGRLRDLLAALHRRGGQRVAVLVDEYDKPILDALRTEDLARANRNALRALYSVIKSCDAHIRFCFLTGVSKFSKVNLFSGLNNLVDITLEPAYSTVCGYTESDLDEVFGPQLKGLNRERIRSWYYGYSWGGEEKVYNPFDLLLLFRKREFEPSWFETGTPTFLVEMLWKRRIPTATLDGMLASSRLLGSFDVGRISTEALLFQSGYLTVQGLEQQAGLKRYRLGYPNREVRQGLNLALLDTLTGEDCKREEHSRALDAMLKAGDIKGLESTVQAMFSTIPSDGHRRIQIDRFEGYYASVFYAYFAGLGVDVTLEDSSSRGRLDMAVRAGGRVYLFEFKVLEQAVPGAALAQLKAKRYADKYRHLDVPVHLVGVEFSMKTRNVDGFDHELARRDA